MFSWSISLCAKESSTTPDYSMLVLELSKETSGRILFGFLPLQQSLQHKTQSMQFLNQAPLAPLLMQNCPMVSQNAEAKTKITTGDIAYTSTLIKYTGMPP